MPDPNNLYGIEIDQALLEGLKDRYRPFADCEPADKYVAFLDILGFKNMVKDH